MLCLANVLCLDHEVCVHVRVHMSKLNFVWG